MIMKDSINTHFANLSLASVSLTAVLTSVHHIFRLGYGPGLLIPVAIIVLLPYVLMHWFTRSGNKWIRVAYAGLAGYIIIAFGFIDGFLDHVMKALGFQNMTFLPGGDAVVVKTVMSLWSPEASNLFYEGTGVLTFVASIVAAYFLYRFMRSERCLAK
jgi:hypothetical protein